MIIEDPLFLLQMILELKNNYDEQIQHVLTIITNMDKLVRLIHYDGKCNYNEKIQYLINIAKSNFSGDILYDFFIALNKVSGIKNPEIYISHEYILTSSFASKIKNADIASWFDNSLRKQSQVDDFFVKDELIKAIKENQYLVDFIQKDNIIPNNAFHIIWHTIGCQNGKFEIFIKQFSDETLDCNCDCNFNMKMTGLGDLFRHVVFGDKLNKTYRNKMQAETLRKFVKKNAITFVFTDAVEFINFSKGKMLKSINFLKFDLSYFCFFPNLNRIRNILKYVYNVKLEDIVFPYQPLSNYDIKDNESDEEEYND